MSQMIKNSKGVTLLELIAAITIIGILSSMAIPAFNNQIKDSRLVANTNLVVGAYNLARSEAINRGLQTTVVPTAGGWAVEEVASGLQIKEFQPDQSGLTWSGYAAVIYNSSGFRPFGSSSVTVKLCDVRPKGRAVTISPVGSTSVEKSPTCP